jgi:uncharacterized membrane protein YvlD (DUF360 family)
MGIAINIVVTAIALQMAGSVIRSFEVSSWGAAFLAAIVFVALDLLVGAGIWTLPPDSPFWKFAAYRLAFNTVIVGLTAWVLPGITLRGPVGLLTGGAAVTLAELASPYVVMTLVSAGVPNLS